MSKKSNYTGVQAYQRKDGKYGWRFVLNGDIRARGTDYYDTIEEAVACAIDVLTYTIDREHK